MDVKTIRIPEEIKSIIRKLGNDLNGDDFHVYSDEAILNALMCIEIRLNDDSYARWRQLCTSGGFNDEEMQADIDVDMAKRLGYALILLACADEVEEDEDILDDIGITKIITEEVGDE